MPADSLDLVIPDWSAPECVVACCTTRGGGSQDCYASLNLAAHVGDDAQRVARNRQILKQALNLPAEPQWLNQTHSIRVIDVDAQTTREGDAAITRTTGAVLAVLTADCLPVLLCNRAGTEVAAAHAGWRGLLHGVLEQTVQVMRSEPAQLLAWLGPAIGPKRFEVGEEVRLVFVEHDAQAADCFIPTRESHYLADLYALARQRLQRLGVQAVSGGEFCTHRDDSRFFSFRRDKTCGRQASIIYIKSDG